MVSQETKYNVCFQGASLDVGNRGCCALAASFVKLITEITPDAKIHFLYANRIGGIQKLKVAGENIEIKIVNCRLSSKSKLNEHLFWIFFLAIFQKLMPIKFLRNKIIESNKWLSTLQEADFVGEIRGGDSFSDIYGLVNFLLGVIPCIIAILMKKKLVMLPQTYGPFKSKIAKILARYIMLRSDRLISRDEESILTARSIMGDKGKSREIQLCPDIAFVLESVCSSEKKIEPPISVTNLPLIGLNISGLLYVGGFDHNNRFGLKVNYKELIDKLIGELLEKTESHILLVPHVFSDIPDMDELTLCRQFVHGYNDKYQGRIHTIDFQYNQNELKGIISMCDFFIGARMHSCIAALSQCIPTIGLAYSKKFTGVFKTAGMEQFALDMRKHDQNEIIKSIFNAIDIRNSTAQELRKEVPKVQDKIVDFFISVPS